MLAIKAPNMVEKLKTKYARKLAFSKFVDSKKVGLTQSADFNSPDKDSGNVTGFNSWLCCGMTYGHLPDLHKHVAYHHTEDIDREACHIMEHGCADAHWSILRKGEKSPSTDHDVQKQNADGECLPLMVGHEDVFPWLPSSSELQSEDCSPASKQGQVLLFYHYREIENVKHVKHWQLELCNRLKLNGKVRIATEGINGTVAGTAAATEVYVQAVIMHPLFSGMTTQDFKRSAGDQSVFHEGLKVDIYQELVPMGLAPSQAPYTEAGDHLSPEEFHTAIEMHMQSKDKDTIFVDCRNFYESKIGRFKGAVTPDIRKFSYWPEYIDQNLDFFRDKSVYMYCTGGIRCERGSAYLKQKGVCKNVYQLHGGIHKYMDKFPKGHYQGKLFVFDDRYAIKANENIISKCIYCEAPWDQYKLCSSSHCSQLVLSCITCQSKGLTACCTTCQHTGNAGLHKEECECTQHRLRVPRELQL